MDGKKWFILWLGILIGGLVSGSWAETVRLGVLAKRGYQIAKKKWGPLADYLSEKTGTKVLLVPITFKGLEPAVKTGKIDYLLANPAFFVRFKEKYGIYALASMLNSYQGKALNWFGGVIFVKAESPIKELKDLKGKKFMVVKISSFGGAYMAFRLLLEKGLNPFKDLRLCEGGTHDNVVFSVRKGIVDAGTVRSNILERMEAEGKIRMAEFRVLHRVQDDFPFVHSTRLYPEWPFAALLHTDLEISAKIRKALLELPPDHPAAKAAKIADWSEPLDYSPVMECLRTVERAKNPQNKD